jgi:hypothetical protein
MFCNRCGKEIADDAVVCIGCGRAVKPLAAVGEKWSTGAMIALVIGTLLVPLIGIIFGIIGLNKGKKEKQGAILLGFGIFMIIINIAVFMSILNNN